MENVKTNTTTPHGLVPVDIRAADHALALVLPDLFCENFAPG